MDSYARQQLPGRPRAVWYRCGSKCPSYLKFDKSNLVPFGYVQNGVVKTAFRPRYRLPYPNIYSIGVKTSFGYTGAQRKIFINQPLNQFGYYAGAPQGYGQPPRNQFN